MKWYVNCHREPIKGDGHGRQLAAVVDGQRPVAAGDFRNGIERHQRAAGRPHMEQREGGRIELVVGFQLQNHLELMGVSIDRGDLAGSVGAVEGVVDLLFGNYSSSLS